MAEGVDGLTRDKTRKPGKQPLPATVVQRVVDLTLGPPPGDATHWTGRMLAKSGWREPAFGATHPRERRRLAPHRVRTFKLSNDPKFAAKVQDVVGLYVDPPEHALVLSVDEKSQIQALDRTQPGLPMKKGRCGTMTHDYKRHGTTTLFAALDVLEGRVIGQCMARHRHQEFIRFLNKINHETAAERELHLIVDNYATHKHPKVRAWLERHPRFLFHFTPTSASWLNAVEGFFAKLTRQRLKRGVFKGIVDLQAAINRYLPKPTKTLSPSPGPPTPTPSSKKSGVGNKRWLTRLLASARRRSRRAVTSSIPSRSNSTVWSRRCTACSPIAAALHRALSRRASLCVRVTIDDHPQCDQDERGNSRLIDISIYEAWNERSRLALLISRLISEPLQRTLALPLLRARTGTAASSLCHVVQRKR